MSDISAWSTTASSNNSASPDGWPEGMAPSGVNDSARENMAAIRTWYDDAEWREWGHTVTYGSGTTFTTASGDGDTTAIYAAGRRVRAAGSTTGTIYGRISGSSHSSVTTVTVVWDSGNLENESLTISVGMLNNLALPVPFGIVGTSGQVISSNGTDAEWVDRAPTPSTIATTSGRAAEFTSIPDWVTQIVMTLVGFSTNGNTDSPLIQIGDSGGFETTGYSGSVADDSGSPANFSIGFVFAVGLTAAAVRHGQIILTRHGTDGLTWACSSVIAQSDAADVDVMAGSKVLSGQLDRIRLQMSGSTDDFDAGSVGIRYS